MAISDVAFQALLGYQADKNARQLSRYQRIGEILPQAASTFLALQEAQEKHDAAQRESRVRYGTPAVGTPASVSVDAAPADSRRRFLGIPLGRAPQPALRVMPAGAGAGGPTPIMQDGDPGTIDAGDIPAELLTGDVSAAMASGRPVFYRPASPNYRPATLGQEEARIRADLLTKMTPASVEDLLTNPDRAAAVRGAKPKVTVKNITIDDDLRQRSVDRYGYDVFDGMPETMSEAAATRILGMAETTFRQQTRPTAGKEGNQLMDEATTRQLYVDEGLTPEEIAKAPVRLKARDYKARRGRLNANARGAALDSLLNSWLGGQAPEAATTPSFATAAEAEAAQKAGRVKPGQRVMIGGKEFVAQ